MQRMTLREIAKKLKVDRNTVHAWMRKGLPYAQPGGRKGHLWFDLPLVEVWASLQASARSALRERESVRGRMRRLVAPAPRTLTRKEIREATKSKRNAENRAKRGQWKLTKPAKPEKGDK